MAIELWHQAGSDQITPARIAAAVNRELCQNNEDRMFVTVFLGLLNTQTGALAYCNAGHPVPHLLRSSGELQQIHGKPEVPLGVRSKSAYQTGTVTLQPGDAVFVVSDGVIEAMNAEGSLYTQERLDADLRSAIKAPVMELVQTVTRNVQAFTGTAPKADDVTALALRWLPT
jgi:sigma-B regulation protein RsbU (phosphoserine phosphatase)